METQMRSQDAVKFLRGIVQESLARNHHLVGRYAAGLTHADSLLQPQPRGNCFNWVVGHIVSNREGMSAILGAESAFPGGEANRYARGSAPVRADGEGVIPFAELLAGLDVQQAQLEQSLATATIDALNAPSSMDGMSVIELLQFLGWHETYHLGQLDQLRQLSGINDTVIP